METEAYQGFVPVTLFLPGQRIEGRAWKFANRRILQQIEEDRRQFLPLVSAKIFELDGSPDQRPEELPVLAVSTQRILAIIPGDATTPVAQRNGESGRPGPRGRRT
ncbi:MAG: hypothetical protein ABSD48_10155 [Armatimonadota bacterium]|jgi:hypothetical protein